MTTSTRFGLIDDIVISIVLFLVLSLRNTYGTVIQGANSLARADVFDYIEVFYNRTLRHSHLGGVSPEAFERASN